METWIEFRGLGTSCRDKGTKTCRRLEKVLELVAEVYGLVAAVCGQAAGSLGTSCRCLERHEVEL